MQGTRQTAAPTAPLGFGVFGRKMRCFVPEQPQNPGFSLTPARLSLRAAEIGAFIYLLCLFSPENASKLLKLRVLLRSDL